METKARKIAQNAIRPISRDGLAATLDTHSPLRPESRFRSSPACVSPPARSRWTNFAMKKPMTRMTTAPISAGIQAKKTSNPRSTLSLMFSAANT